MIERTYMIMQEERNYHFDSEQDIHMSSLFPGRTRKVSDLIRSLM